MFRRLSVLGIGGVSALLVAAPLFAHEVEISGSVGGTMHIQPNDNPRAGQVSQAWFALIRRGGAAIPLSACNCQLAVYAQPIQERSQPIARPALQSVSAEGRQGIPGAAITFPRPGAYTVVLRGRPVQAGQFSDFELRFDVTVAR